MTDRQRIPGGDDIEGRTAARKAEKATRITPRVRRPRVDPLPWERQPGEAEKAYAAFEVYRDDGEERSFRNTATNRGLAQRTIEYYAQRYLWAERVLAYDSYMTRAAITKRRKGVEAMQERHIQTAMLMQSRIITRLQEVRPDELSIDQLGKWFDLAVKVERQSRGEQEQPAMQVNIAANQQIGTTTIVSGNPLADYLDKHPERIPYIMPLIERFVGGDHGALADIEDAIGVRVGAAAGLPELLESDAGQVRPADVGDGDGQDQAAEGGAARLPDPPLPG